jgi:hypothetical protein
MEHILGDLLELETDGVFGADLQLLFEDLVAGQLVF